MDIFIQIFMIRCGASGNGALFGMVSVRIVLRKNRKKPSFRYVLAAGKTPAGRRREISYGVSEE